jgi:LysR family transcriptional regulator, transcriptional activator for bauABCD operon
MAQVSLNELGQVGDYEIRLLKVFKTVVECGGFSAAETVLNISRSTISVHMANLEQRLKLKLCNRGRAGFALTEEGAIIYESVRRLFSQLEDFRSTVNALHVHISGELKLVASDTISLDERCRFPEVLAEFCRQAPDVFVQFETAPMSDIERMILNGEVDVGFIPYHRQLDGLIYQPLYEETCYLYCCDCHPLFHEPDEEKVREGLQNCRSVQAGIQSNPEVALQMVGLAKTATAYYYETRAVMILSGAYVGYLPEHYANKWVTEGRMRKLLPAERSYRLGLAAITHQFGRLNKPRDFFMRLLQQQMERNRLE